MDKICLKGMCFFGYHGVLPEEQTLGQRFVVDVTLYLDLFAAGMRDALEETVDYTRVYALIKDIVEKERYKLIEALASRIAGRILESFRRVKKVTVTVHKPEVPIPGVLSEVEAEVTRRQTISTVLALGSNIEPKEEYIHRAVELLNKHPRLKVCRTSSLYSTEPVGYVDQEWFLNAVVVCETDLEPLELLQEVQRIEALLGRERKVRWGPRTIDIDIILYDQERIDIPGLTIPHPRAFERAFVLVPLAEVWEGEVCAGKTAKDLLAQLGSPTRVEYYGPLTVES